MAATRARFSESVLLGECQVFFPGFFVDGKIELVDDYDTPEREGLRKGRFTVKDPEVFSGFFPLLGMQKEVGQVPVRNEVFGIECEGLSISFLSLQETAFPFCFPAFFQCALQRFGQTVEGFNKWLAGQE